MSTAAATVFRGCRALMSPAAAAAKGGKKTASAAAKGGKKPASAAAKPKADKKLADPNNLRGIMRPVPVSDALRKFGGAAHISRSGVLKIVWDYIKANDLQNPANKREIICDEKLKTIFPGRDTVHMMEVTKLLSPHFVKTI